LDCTVVAGFVDGDGERHQTMLSSQVHVNAPPAANVTLLNTGSTTANGRRTITVDFRGSHDADGSLADMAVWWSDGSLFQQRYNASGGSTNITQSVSCLAATGSAWVTDAQSARSSMVQLTLPACVYPDPAAVLASARVSTGAVVNVTSDDITGLSTVTIPIAMDTFNTTLLHDSIEAVTAGLEVLAGLSANTSVVELYASNDTQALIARANLRLSLLERVSEMDRSVTSMHDAGTVDLPWSMRKIKVQRACMICQS